MKSVTTTYRNKYDARSRLWKADQFSQQAADKIREIIDCPHATVRF